MESPMTALPLYVDDSRSSSVASTTSATSERGIVPPPRSGTRNVSISRGVDTSPIMRSVISFGPRVMCPAGMFTFSDMIAPAISMTVRS